MYKPRLHDVKVIDAKEAYIFEFDVFSGKQTVGSELVITEANSGQTIYKLYRDNLRKEHRIGANTLKNGMMYQAKVRVKDVAGGWSPYSDIVLFACYSKPIITIPTIDELGRVYNQTVLFEATYKQNEGDKLESYRYNLYNANKTLLSSFEQKFPDGDGLMKQEITGLRNGTQYHIEVITLSVSGNKGASGLIPFKPLYVAPKISLTIDPQNIPEEGAVKLRASIVQIILELYDDEGKLIPYEEVEYVDGKKLDMNRSDYSKLRTDVGFDFEGGDFVLKFWIEKMPIGKIVEVTGKDTDFILERDERNKMRLSQQLKGSRLSTSYYSNTFNPNVQNCITIRSVSGQFDITVEEVVA